MDKNKTELNRTEEKMDTGAGRISKLCKKWRRPRNNSNNNNAMRCDEHTRFPSSEAVLWLCCGCDSAFIIGVLYVNHTAIQSSWMFPNCCPFVDVILSSLSCSLLLLLLLLSVPFYRLAFDNTFFCRHKTPKQAAHCVPTVAITHLQQRDKMQNFSYQIPRI